MAQQTTDTLSEFSSEVSKGDEISIKIRVAGQTDTIKLTVKYTTPDGPEIGLSPLGDGRQYGKLMTPPVSGSDDTDVRLVTRSEDQHNADVLEMSA